MSQLRPAERLVESNYFFRMGQYQSWLVDYIHTHPNFIQPDHRRNEVLGFLRRPLGDLCISRPGSRLNWGIPLPFDPDYVTYVWFDALRYFLMRDMTPGRDASFSQRVLHDRYHADLANDLGNLLHRLLNMINRYCDGNVPAPGSLDASNESLRDRTTALPTATLSAANDFAVHDALALVMETVGEINRYLEQTAPWHEAKTGSQARVNAILYTATETLRLCSVLLWPTLPERMGVLWQRLGWSPPESLHEGLVWGLLRPGTAVAPGPPLFPRVVVE